jgi:hypothetical protein
LPNPQREPDVKWDAYVFVDDPDTLSGEFAARGVRSHEPLMVTSEQLLGFENADPDGYALFFGRPE